MGLLNTCTTASFEHLLMTSAVHNLITSSSCKDSWLFGLPTHSSLPGMFCTIKQAKKREVL